MLEVKDLCVNFGDLRVLNNVSFRADEGEWIMIAGPNGAGKSTVLNAISQTVKYSGEILFNEKDVKKMKPQERASKIGILTQNHFVGYDFTVEEVVSLGRYSHTKKLLGGESEGNKEAIEKALDETGLTGLKKKSVLKLSGGELQRTFLAQVFAQNPSVLLLDEPTNHLDLAYQKQVFGIIKEWLSRPGRTVISVVHDLSLAKAYGTKAILLQDGVKLADGPAREVLSGEKLNEVYNIDVSKWMQTLLKEW